MRVNNPPQDAILPHKQIEALPEQDAQLQLVHAVHAASPIEPGQESDMLRIAKIQAGAGANGV